MTRKPLTKIATLSKCIVGMAVLTVLLDAAIADAGPACDAARAYTRLVQSQRYDQIGKLFASDGVWFTPVGKVMHGRDQISKFYQNFLGDRRPIFRTENYVDGGRVCAMEVSMKVRVDGDGRVVLGPDGAAAIIPQGSNENGIFVFRAMDHFTVDAQGLVVRMTVYNAPLSYWVE